MPCMKCFSESHESRRDTSSPPSSICAGRFETRLSQEPPINRHRPSVEALFRSAAQAREARPIGVMLSGMGADGAEAMLDLRQRGAHNIAQDEASCVVFGMPKQAIALGAVHDILPLSEIAPRLVELCLAND